VDIERFRPYFDPRLPVLDFGCGNGRQTRFLAKQFERVIGTDVSPRAIDLARQETAAAGMNIDYRVLDALRPEQARAFHAEFGDVNIYMRTVLHVIQRKDRKVFAESLATLLGEKGTLYQIELALCALDYFITLPGNSPSGLPSHVHNVIKTGATSVGFDPQDRPLVYPDEHWQILAEGPDTIKTVPLHHGDEGHVPASYLILRTRRAS
jgi:SAM-dependent methyltransferase